MTGSGRRRGFNYFDRLGAACLGVVGTEDFIIRSVMGAGGLLLKGIAHTNEV